MRLPLSLRLVLTDIVIKSVPNLNAQLQFCQARTIKIEIL